MRGWRTGRGQPPMGFGQPGYGEPGYFSSLILGFRRNPANRGSGEGR